MKTCIDHCFGVVVALLGCETIIEDISFASGTTFWLLVNPHAYVVLIIAVPVVATEFCFL